MCMHVTKYLPFFSSLHILKIFHEDEFVKLLAKVVFVSLVSSSRAVQLLIDVSERWPAIGHTVQS